MNRKVMKNNALLAGLVGLAGIACFLSFELNRKSDYKPPKMIQSEIESVQANVRKYSLLERGITKIGKEGMIVGEVENEYIVLKGKNFEYIIPEDEFDSYSISEKADLKLHRTYYDTNNNGKIDNEDTFCRIRIEVDGKYVFVYDGARIIRINDAPSF